MIQNIRDILLITIYGFFIIVQLSLSSYIIYNEDKLSEILKYKNITECTNNAIYRLDNGTLIHNSLAIIISSSIIIGSFILIIIDKYIPNRHVYKSLDDTIINQSNSIISTKIISREKYDITLHNIFIMSIISFIVCNAIQFILQIDNINDICLYFIDSKLNKFYVIYKNMTFISFFASYALIFIILCFL